MRPRSWRLQWVGLAALVAVALIAIGVAQTAAGRSVLRSAGITSGSQRYSELAFTHPAQLADKLKDGSGRLAAPAAVHNLEGAPRSYRWVASEQPLGESPTRLDSGTVSVRAGRWGSIKPHLQVTCGNSLRVYVRLALERPSQSIGFWVECPRGLLQQWRAQQRKGGTG